MVIPSAYEELINVIVERHPQMTEGNKKIAKFLVQNPNDAALLSLNKISKKIDISPSTLVKFAKLFGYSGFSDMQRIFELRLRIAAPGFTERVSTLKKELEISSVGDQIDIGILRKHVINDVTSLNALLDVIDEKTLRDTVELIKRSKTIFVVGQLGSYPVAFFFKYLLTMLKLDVRLLDIAGGLSTEEAKAIDNESMLLAISFAHYAHETVQIAEICSANGVPVAGITDSILSPLSKSCTYCFYMPEKAYSFSQSLAAPMCLANVIVYTLATDLEGRNTSDVKIPVIPPVKSRK